MSFQAYLDSVKAKTGKTAEDFKALAAEKGLTSHSALLAWLKTEYGLGHGHANAIIHVITSAGQPEVSSDDGIAAHFKGAKATWQPTFEALTAHVQAFGSDIGVAPGKTYISLVRNEKKFAIVQLTGNRFDLGIKLKGAAPEGKFEAAGAWNAMVTHRVQITDASQLDADVFAWLKRAYDAA
jgi:Domain of unknown function (DUF4287)/Domain of unknown function (DUF5655)